MKLHSTNFWYVAGLGPPLVVLAALGHLALAPSPWAWLPPALLAAILYPGLRKLAHLPRAAREYEEMNPIDIDLPPGYDVDVMACPAMDRHDFIPRVAELLSPWRFPPEGKPVVAVSPGLHARHGAEFTAMAVVREVERYHRGGQVKNVVLLLAPILLLASAVLAAFLYGAGVIGQFGLNFIAPTLTAALFVGHLLLWNRGVSKRDAALDTALAALFPPDRVRAFITAVEELEQGPESDKCRAMNEYYAKQRLNRLD